MSETASRAAALEKEMKLIMTIGIIMIIMITMILWRRQVNQLVCFNS